MLPTGYVFTRATPRAGGCGRDCRACVSTSPRAYQYKCRSLKGHSPVLLVCRSQHRLSQGGWHGHGTYCPDSTAPVPTASLGISAGCWVAPVGEKACNYYLRHLRPKFCCSASLDGFYLSFYCLIFWSFRVSVCPEIPGSWLHYME